MGSIFELSQAKALQSRGIKTAVISVGYHTAGNVLKALASRAAGKRYNYYRLQGHGFFALLDNLFKTIWYAAWQKTEIRKLTIQDVVVYEAVFYRLYFKLNEQGHQAWVRHGYAGYQSYKSNYGKPDLIHGHSRFLLAGLLAQKIRQKENVDYIVTEHSSFYQRKLVSEFQASLMRKVIEESKKLVVVSSALGRTVNATLKCTYSYDIIPNIIDPLFEQSSVAVKRESNFTFLNIAALDPKKDQANLIRAFALYFKGHEEVILKIGGDGEEYGRLVDLAEKEEIGGQVCFLGKLSHEEVKKEMMDCDVFVLPSLHETFGVVVIEALACGKPVVSTRCGGPEDILTEDNGILVPVSDIDALGEAMHQLKTNYKNYDAEKIRKHCLNKYGKSAISGQLIRVYRSAIQKN